MIVVIDLSMLKKTSAATTVAPKPIVSTPTSNKTGKQRKVVKLLKGLKKTKKDN